MTRCDNGEGCKETAMWIVHALPPDYSGRLLCGRHVGHWVYGGATLLADYNNGLLGFNPARPKGAPFIHTEETKVAARHRLEKLKQKWPHRSSHD